TISNVVANCIVEQQRILQNGADIPAQGALLESPQIHAIETDRSLERIIKAHDQGYQCCLARAARSNDCQSVAAFHLDRNPIENRPFQIFVTELNIFECDLAPDISRVDGIGCVAEMLLDVENR